MTECFTCGRPRGRDDRVCLNCGELLPALSEVVADVVPKRGAERRQMTALFCDIVDSVGLSVRLDPEDLMQVYDLYRACSEEVIARHGGYLAQYMGDGILAYFGFPRANEDDAANAVRAGLELVSRVPGLQEGLDPPLRARVGIATGLVVVSDPVGRGGGGTPGIVGKMPNLAARLQSIASPGGVVISEATQNLTRGHFTYADLGPVSLKGFAEPVRAWEATGVSDVRSRFEARVRGAESPFVGRESQMEILLSAWRSASAGEGRVVLLRGEAGIGKSRLVEALEAEISNERRARLRWFCSPQHVESPYHPVIDQIERAAKIDRTDNAEGRLAKLLGQFGDIDDTLLAVLGALVSTSLGRSSPLDDVTPERRAEITSDTLFDMVGLHGGGDPVLMLVEDVHWIDSSSLELLDRLVRHAATRRLLLIVTARPEFRPRWTELPSVQSIDLERLDAESAGRLCGRLAGDRLPAEVQREILDRGDGNPLFVEELTRSVMESLGDRGADAAGAADLVIPQTLHDSLIARLDRLGPARHAANVGAVIGRRFDYALLAEVAAKAPLELHADVARLVRAGLVNEFGAPPSSSYVFRHALIRDAAYDSLLRADRQALHAQLAKVLDTKFPYLIEAEPEIMAYHLERSGAEAAAIPYLERAGHKATARGAHLEASRHYHAALAAIRKQEDSPERARRELAIELPLARSVSSTANYASQAFLDVLTRAKALCDRIGDDESLYPVLRGLFTYSLVRGDARAAQDFAERCLQIGENTGRPPHLIESHVALGYVRYTLGEFRAARTHLEAALELYARHPEAQHTVLAEQDSRVAGGSMLGMVLCSMGHFDEAQRVAEETLAWARTLGRPFDIVYALVYAANVAVSRRDVQLAQRLGQEAISICETYGFKSWLLPARSSLACAKGMAGQTASAIEDLESVIAVWSREGQHLQAAAGIGMLAGFYAEAGRLDDARQAIDRAIEEALAYDDLSYLAGLYMIRANIQRMSPEADLHGVAASLRQALTVARAQEAAVLEAAASATLRRVEARLSQ